MLLFFLKKSKVSLRTFTTFTKDSKVGIHYLHFTINLTDITKSQMNKFQENDLEVQTLKVFEIKIDKSLMNKSTKRKSKLIRLLLTLESKLF